jgi:hypothetical protein
MDSNPPQDRRRFAPATQRNREAILGVLKTALPASGLVLEVASGTGEHAMFFARELPGLTWQPSDPDPQARASIAAWRKTAGPANLLEPLALDASASDWPIAGAQAMVCINMLHISAWAAGEGLMLGAGRLLSRGAPLMIYGPFRREGLELEPSNAAFDEDLRARNPAWGLRLVHEVAACASGEGLMLEQVLQMPANNLALVFRKI